MDYNKILKFIVLIIVILFFSYINSRKEVEEKSNTKEGFTSDIREYFNKKRREVRHKVEEFKTKTSNTVNKVYKKFNN